MQEGSATTLTPLDARFEAFVVVTILVIVTPGPDTALVTRNALRSGWGAASLTAPGVGVGSLIWAMASTAGVGVLLRRVRRGVERATGAVLIGLGARLAFERW